jgi:hypothetical protein
MQCALFVILYLLFGEAERRALPDRLLFGEAERRALPDRLLD